MSLLEMRMWQHTSVARGRRTKICNPSVAVMLRESHERSTWDALLKADFMSITRPIITNNHLLQLRSPDDLGCCFMAVLSWWKPTWTQNYQKLWTNTRERTQSKEKDQAEDSSQFPRVVEVLLRETARKGCPDPENIVHPMIAPQDKWSSSVRTSLRAARWCGAQTKRVSVLIGNQLIGTVQIKHIRALLGSHFSLDHDIIVGATGGWEVCNVIFASCVLVPCTHSHGTWINTCVIRRFCESFWFHNLLIKHQVDVVPKQRQSFVVIVFKALSRIPCPSVHSANTKRFWWWHGHKAGRKIKWKTEKMVTRAKHKHHVFVKNDTIVPWGIDASVCKCRRCFRSILILGIHVSSDKYTWDGPSRGTGERETFKAFRTKTLFSLMCMNVPHHVDKNALCSVTVLKFGWTSTSNNLPVFTAVIKLSAFADAFVKRSAKQFGNEMWAKSWILPEQASLTQHGNHVDCLRLFR